jgi:hypothetical protein
MTACSYAHYVRVLHYYCLFDINIEIKEAAAVCFSLCKLTGCKLRVGVNLQEMLNQKCIEQTGVKQGLGMNVIKFYKLNKRTDCI